MLRTILQRVTIAIGLTIVLGIGWLALKTTTYEGDRREAEWRSLTRIIHSLQGRTLPDAWTFGVFISSPTINNLLSGLRNTTVSFDSQAKPNEDIVLTVKEITVDLKPGLPTGKVSLVAESKNHGLRVELDGEMALIFKGIEIDSEKKPVATFGIQLLRLSPAIQSQFFDFSVRGYASELLTTGTVVVLAKALNLSFPLPDRPVLDLSIKRTDRVPVRDPKNENWVDLASTGGPGKLEEEVSFSHPILVDGGMWFGAERRQGGQANLEVVDRGSRTDAQLDKEIAEMRNQLNAFKVPSAETAGLAIWLNGKALGNVVRRVASLPEERRTVTIQSSGYKGYLAKKDWSDKILGNGGVFVEFNKPDAVYGTISVDTINASWVPEKGVVFTTHVKVAGKADVHLHVDPLIGGGVGTNVGMLGTATIDLNGVIATNALKLGNRNILAFFPRIECRELSVELTTDGKLAGDWGWTKVPRFGGRFNTPIKPSLFAPSIIYSDAAHVIRGRMEDGSPLQVKAGGDTYRVTPPWKMATISVVPVGVVMKADGALVEASLTIALAPVWSDTTKARDESESKLRADFAAAQWPAECPGDPTIAVVLGDIEFGPNNEIVKFLRNAWNDLTKGPGKNNEIVKVVRAAVEALTAAGKPIDDVTKNTLNELNGLANKTFGGNSEAAKQVNTIIKTVAPPTVGKNPDGGVTVTVPGGGTVSTGGHHGGLGVSVQTPVGGFKF